MSEREVSIGNISQVETYTRCIYSPIDNFDFVKKYLKESHV